MTTKISSIAILLIGSTLLVILSCLTGLNRTEVAHLGAASYFWETGRFDLFHVNPPLGRMVSGLPIRLMETEHDMDSYSPRPQDRSEWRVGEAFVFSNEPLVVRRAYIAGRLALIPILFFGGFFGVKLARDIFGNGADIVFAVLWSFSPLCLGWGATMCPDMAAASLGMIAVYFFRRWFLSPNWKNVALAGLFIGLLPLAKITWIVAFGLFPLIWLLSKNRSSWKQFVVIMLVAVYVLNMGYGFDGSFRLLKNYEFISQTFSDGHGPENPGSNRFSETPFGYLPVPFPAEFVLGIDTQKRDFEQGLESYLFGTYSEHGWWYYYFVVLLLKEPIGTLLLILLAVGMVLLRRNDRAAWNDELLIVLPFVTIFLVLCVQTGFSIHPRYLLPVLPFLYLYVSRVGKTFQARRKTFQVFVVGCLVFMVGSSFCVYPYSMSYINEVIPFRKRPEILLGSNLDWGQDAWFLKSRLEHHPEVESIRIAYPCPERIERIGIASEGLPPTIPEPGWYALGINDIYAASGLYSWFKETEPVAFVGYSIYIYHVTPEEADRIRKENDWEPFETEKEGELQ